MALLVRREQSVRELQRKLSNFDDDLVQQTLQQLQRQNLQSNQRFADMLVRSRANQGKGVNHIVQELKQHQISASEQHQALSDYANEVWQELAEKVWRKKFKVPAKTLVEKQKQQRFLASRGFRPDDWRGFL